MFPLTLLDMQLNLGFPLYDLLYTALAWLTLGSMVNKDLLLHARKVLLCSNLLLGAM